MPNIFDDPFIDKIKRDAALERGKPKVLGKLSREAGKDSRVIIDEEIPEDVGGEIAGAAKSIPIVDEMFRKMRKVYAIADTVEQEAEAIIQMQLSGFNRDLTLAPDNVVDAVNQLCDVKYSNIPNNALNLPTELRFCDLKCINAASSLGGNYPSPDDVNDMKDKLMEANTLADSISEQAESRKAKLSGWEMFMFMVKFIAAYSAHMILGYLCCYVKDKLILGVTAPPGLPTVGEEYLQIKLGKKLGEVIGKVERRVKKLLGFPCRDTKTQAKCKEEDGSIAEDAFNVFPCCTPYESVGSSCIGSAVGAELNPNNPLDSKMEECLGGLIEELLNNEFGKSTAKVCGNCTGKPESIYIDGKVIALADSVVSWAQAISIALELEKENKYNDAKVKLQTLAATGAMKNFASHAKNMAKENGNILQFGGLDLPKLENSELCDLMEKEGGLDKLLGKPFDDLTLDDLRDALLDNIDIDITQFLGAEDRGQYGAESCNETMIQNGKAVQRPLGEPFSTLCNVTNLIDEKLTAVLEEIRKYLAMVKYLSGLSVSRDFCCIVYTFVFLANLIRYRQLCPKHDITTLFQFADTVKFGKDLDRVICELKFIKKLLEALMGELIGEFSIIGIGLPLGTLIEILKKIVANTVVALASIALAPLSNLLQQLEQVPGLKDLLNANCFGIGDLLLMLQCGIQWLLDLIKEWAADLIPLSAKNQQLIPDIRIRSMRFAFLEQLLDLINLLLDLLLNIGDCYTTEVIVEEILNTVEDTARVVFEENARLQDEIPDLPEVGLPIYLDNIEVSPSIAPAIIKELSDPPVFPGETTVNTFPIYPSEMTRFRESVERNMISLETISEIDEFGAVTFDEDALEELIGAGTSREEARKSLLNLVNAMVSVGDKKK